MDNEPAPTAFAEVKNPALLPELEYAEPFDRVVTVDDPPE